MVWKFILNLSEKWRYEDIIKGFFFFRDLGRNCLGLDCVDRIIEYNVGSGRFRCWILDFYLNKIFRMYLCFWMYFIIFMEINYVFGKKRDYFLI